MSTTSGRTIYVSTDVFAAIWALRLPGEHEEDVILRRLVGCASGPGHDLPSPATPLADKAMGDKAPLGEVGFSDLRYRFKVPEGFEIFRTFLNKNYRAIATGGAAVLHDSGKRYESLNALSIAIDATHENAWTNWYYLKSNGKVTKLSELRDHSLIGTRSRRRPKFP